MAEGKNAIAQWILSLKEEISGDAKKAAGALDELRKQIKSDQTELAGLQKQMRELKAKGGDELKGSIAQLKEQITAKKNAIGKSKDEYKRLAASSDALKTRTATLKAVMSELGKAAGRLPGPLGTIATKLIQMASKMGSSRAMAVALGAGFIALGAGAAFAASKLLSFAIASQDARRNELLHFEALTKQRNLWGIMPGKASDMQDAVDQVSASVSISREKVAAYASQLYQAGLRGNNLKVALEGTSIKASALGEGAGSAFASWAGALALTGGNVKRLSEDIKNRFGGVVAKQMKSLEVSQMKMQEGFASLFTGLNIEPFLSALTQLRNLFSQNTESGRALKFMMSQLLGPLLDSSTSGLVVIRRFFKQMIIGALEIQIAFLTVRNWLRKAFGGEQHDTVKKFLGAFQWGRLFVYTLAAAFGAMAVSLLVSLGPILAVAAGIWGLLTIGEQLYDLWKEIDWSDLGKAVVDGIVNGVTATWSKISTTMQEFGKEAKDAFKMALGIQSPSKVFADLGQEIPAGVKVGVKRGAPDAQHSVDKMVVPRLGTSTLKPAEPPPPAPTAAAGGTAGKQGMQLTIGELHVHAKTDDPKAYAQELRRAIENVLEGAALQLGARPLGGS